MKVVVLKVPTFYYKKIRCSKCLENGQVVFKQKYPETLSLIIGSVNYGLEDFLLGKKSLFL